MAGWRLPVGGAAIDRARPLAFSFDGRPLHGFFGDTLGSALLANGVALVGRSFKYHRARGVTSAGPEEAGALVTLGAGARRQPNANAAIVELQEGLEAHSQNRWPSLRFDLGATAQLFAPFLAAGFYYKTFMGPTRRSWMFYERFIRRAAGMGAATHLPDPDRYERANAFCDVLVIGGGPAGLMAASVAQRAGARVLLADERPRFGGGLVGDPRRIDGRPAQAWIDSTVAALAAAADVTLLPRTTVWGYYDGNILAAVQHVDPDEAAASAPVRQRHWRIQAQAVVLSTGAIERPIAFAGNDIPGVLLAGAARAYACRWGVAVGRNVGIFTNNDSGLSAALDLIEAGVPVSAVIDARDAVPPVFTEPLARHGVALLAGYAVVRAFGAPGGLRFVDAAPLREGEAWRPGEIQRIALDALAVSGGWQPNLHLASQAGGRPVWDETLAAFLPGARRERWRAAGACAGRMGLAAACASGAQAGAAAASEAGFATAVPAPPAIDPDPEGASLRPLWAVPAERGGKTFVDLQTDVTVDDVRLAHREGFRSVEHLKRYTTLGMGVDQGKTGNVIGLALMAELEGRAVPAVGTTTFRPPYAPVSIGAIAGRERGMHFQPARRTALHDWHVAQGGDMRPFGPWYRPVAYLQPGETLAQAAAREARAVRESVGIVDVSTLGKIDVCGPDAALFLDRVYAGRMANLRVGRARYGLMLRDDGMVMDDGTAWRLSETRFLVTTTTANAVEVMRHLEFLLAVAWPELRVHVASVTDCWAGMAVSGPRSRAVLEAALQDVDLADAAFPPMAVERARCGGVPVLVARLSFSGERAYEVYCGWREGAAVWAHLLQAGAAHGILPYGIEALSTLRIEKGHVAGPELDGRTTPHDLGLSRLVADKPHVGRVLLRREALRDPNRLRLVGLRALAEEPVRGGAQLVASPDPKRLGRSEGHVTSWAFSPTLGCHIALALLERGPERHGERLFAADPLRRAHAAVEVVAPCFLDPEGARLHA